MFELTGLNVIARLGLTAGLALLLLAALACGLSDEELNRLIDQRAQAIVAAAPTVTPPPTATPQPSPTPQPAPTPRATATPQPAPTRAATATPQPTATPLVLPPVPTPAQTATPQPTATPVSFPPTATPVVFPPTATPVVFPPTATPQPTPTPQAVTDFRAIHQNAWPSVFMIRAGNAGGTGWLIEPGLIVTNQHVVTYYRTVKVYQAKHPGFTATVLATDRRRDVALLRFEPDQVELHPAAQPLLLGQVTEDDIAQELLALGYSTTNVRDDGTVGAAAANVGVLSQTGVPDDQQDVQNLYMDVPVDPGDSGGPVFNRRGEVIGMVRAAQISAGGKRVVGTFFAVHVDEIREALPALKRGDSSRYGPHSNMD